MKPVRITTNIEYKNCFIKELQRLGYTKGIYENHNKTKSFFALFSERLTEKYILFTELLLGVSA